MKKGFTLVELLAVVFILGIIVTVVSVSSLSTIREANERAFLMLVAQIEGAAEEYAINYSDVLTKLTPSNNTTFITLSDLQQQNLLDIKITDPRNDSTIKNTEQIKVERLTSGTIAYTFLYSDVANYKPTIVLYGSDTVYLEQGQPYVEAGAYATDYTGKDISTLVQTTGTVNSSLTGIYEIQYIVTDALGNTSNVVTRTVEVVPSQVPTVAFNPNGNTTYAKTYSSVVTVSDNVAVNPSSLEYQWTTSTTAPTEASFTTAFTNGGTVNSPAGLTGGYYLWILAKDTSGNTAIVKSDVFNLDNTIPTVAFGTNGNTTYSKTRSTTVTVSDNISLNTSSLEYQWTTSTTAPTEASFTTTFTNGGTISSPAGVSGGYYLWILGKDTLGNTMIARSNVFNLDNTVPVITMTGSTPLNIQLGSVYTDAGATATDNVDGTITSRITTVNNVNTSVSGTYTVTYNVTDLSGNAATQVTRTVNVSLTVDYLVVGGGGAGGGGNNASNDHGYGGGGGGGVKTGTLNMNPGSYAITVGAGGTVTACAYCNGGNGGSSSIASLVVAAGGGGGGAESAGSAGASGGGGGVSYAGGAGTAGQGYAGATGIHEYGGGGGGAGAVGNGVHGGNGVYVANFALWGDTAHLGYYGGGGGAGVCGCIGDTWQYGGWGGGGSSWDQSAPPGQANTGGGGAGGGSEMGYETRYGGVGGSGIVIVRYAGTVAKGTGGTITISGGYVYHVFTASGTLVLN